MNHSSGEFQLSEIPVSETLRRDIHIDVACPSRNLYIEKSAVGICFLHWANRTEDITSYWLPLGSCGRLRANEKRQRSGTRFTLQRQVGRSQEIYFHTSTPRPKVMEVLYPLFKKGLVRSIWWAKGEFTFIEPIGQASTYYHIVQYVGDLLAKEVPKV